MIYLLMMGCMERGLLRALPAMLVVPVYWAMMSVAAYKALGQLLIPGRRHYWELTRHGLVADTASGRRWLRPRRASPRTPTWRARAPDDVASARRPDVTVTPPFRRRDRHVSGPYGEVTVTLSNVEVFSSAALCEQTNRPMVAAADIVTVAEPTWVQVAPSPDVQAVNVFPLRCSRSHALGNAYWPPEIRS